MDESETFDMSKLKGINVSFDSSRSFVTKIVSIVPF